MKRLNEEASCLDAKVGAQQEQHKLEASRPRPRRVLPRPKNLGTSESGQKTTASYGMRIMLCLRHGTAPRASRKTAIQAIKDLEEAETAATGRLHACCAIQSSFINEDIDDTTTKGHDMSESTYASKSKEPPTLMAQSICEEPDRDQFSELDSSDAPANNVESDVDSEVVEPEPEPEPVTKKKKTKRDMKDKDKVPITNLRDEIRANRQKILNPEGCLKVEGQVPD
jgi:hypothetical protein